MRAFDVCLIWETLFCADLHGFPCSSGSSGKNTIGGSSTLLEPRSAADEEMQQTNAARAAPLMRAEKALGCEGLAELSARFNGVGCGCG